MFFIGDRKTGTRIQVSPTIFPDRTSQFWKLDSKLFTFDNIIWKYESEAEVPRLFQLLMLFQKQHPNYQNVQLYIPFMPYARQDKEVSNDLTFALKPFLAALNTFISLSKVYAFDVHSACGVVDLKPTLLINEIYKLGYDGMVFPDNSAMLRYQGLIGAKDYITMKKVRDQASGKITGQDILFMKMSKAPNKLLMIDDLIDAGASFNGAARSLKSLYPDVKIELFVSHGIFSQGYGELAKWFDHVHTTNTFMMRQDCPFKDFLNVFRLENYYAF